MLDDFPRVWLVDFEYTARAGEGVQPICCVAHELHSGQQIERWLWDQQGPESPFSFGSNDLMIAYSAPAELSCFLALGWAFPPNVLDLFVEYRAAINGVVPPGMWGLLRALEHYGVAGIEQNEKTEMRELAIRGGPFSDSDRDQLLPYCASDVVALLKLLPLMMPAIDLPRALLRGQYQTVVARIEARGIPIDTARLDVLRARWDAVRTRLAQRANLRYPGVFNGKSFDEKAFQQYLGRCQIDWPRLDSGRLALDSDTWDSQIEIHPSLRHLRDLRHAIVQLRTIHLPVGADGRARTSLGAWGSRTGRNQPRAGEFIFAMSKWLRSLVKPAAGAAIAYVDWSSAEFGIAAALAKDPKMQAAYRSGDVYMTFAVQAGAAPPGATKVTHAEVRERYKRCILGAQFGIGQGALALRIGRSTPYARMLLEQHRRTYSTYWSWVERASAVFAQTGQISTRLGWPLRRGYTHELGARNFPTQGNGSELMRIAAIFAERVGIRIVAVVHDAFLIEASLSEIEVAVRAMQTVMADASRCLLDGFELRSDATIFRHPDRYVDEDGVEMWDLVWATLGLEP